MSDKLKKVYHVTAKDGYILVKPCSSSEQQATLSLKIAKENLSLAKRKSPDGGPYTIWCFDPAKPDMPWRMVKP